MIPGLYSYVATGLVVAALASAGTWRVQEWRWGSKEAQRLQLEPGLFNAGRRVTGYWRDLNDGALRHQKVPVRARQAFMGCIDKEIGLAVHQLDATLRDNIQHQRNIAGQGVLASA